MKHTKFYFLLITILSVTLFSCSELKDDITTPLKIGVHGLNVLNPASQNFHGLTVKEKTLESCKQCHSANFSGGTAKLSCLECHEAVDVHKEGILDHDSAAFHGEYIAEKGWSLSICSQCHGKQYQGGVAAVACIKCHTNPGGPEACNTCHGNFNDTTKIAPPRDLEDGTETTESGVGAHSTHLYNVKIASNVKCSDCHTVPASYSSIGHIDSSVGAELTFSKISNYEIGSASYDRNTFKCSNTYCHGGFEFSKAKSQYQFIYVEDKIQGNNFNPVWNKVDGSQAKCGTCHGLPPKGHAASEIRSCGTCHQGVVDANGVIIDPSKHLNGKVDVFSLVSFRR
ncbi:MAG: cytochrome c3 family protein [Bacteroidota bacterium]